MGGPCEQDALVPLVSRDEDDSSALLQPRYIYPPSHIIAMIGSAGWGQPRSARLGTSSAEGSGPEPSAKGRRPRLSPPGLHSLLGAIDETPTIDDKAMAAVDSEWRTAREIYAILAKVRSFQRQRP